MKARENLNTVETVSGFISTDDKINNKAFKTLYMQEKTKKAKVFSDWLFKLVFNKIPHLNYIFRHAHEFEKKIFREVISISIIQ